MGVARIDRWLSPECDCAHDVARLSFLLRKPQRIDVELVDRDGELVLPLAEDERRPAGRVQYEWDGRNAEGAVVPDGLYRVRVHLLDDRRTIVIPVDLRVDTRPPAVRRVAIAPTTVAAGGEVEIRFAPNEFGVPLVIVDGKVAARGPAGKPGASTVTWEAPVAGTYEVAVALEDRAGNVSEPAGTTAVVVTQRR